MPCAMFCLVVIALTMMSGAHSYSDGATSDSCYSMLPAHHHNDQSLIPPINCSSSGADQCNGMTLTVTHNGVSDVHYICDSEHQVTLTSEREFVGYLIQARVPVAGAPFTKYRILGTIISAGPQGRVLYCYSTADSPGADEQPNSATQNASIPVRSVTITWRAPHPFIAQGNIQFYATVVEDYSHSYFPVTSEILEPLSSTCQSYLPYLSLGTTGGVETVEVVRLDDWASDPIPIPSGLPFATYNHTVLYIGTNGVFSFAYRETGYWHHISDPTRFYAAPFWGDINTEEGGNITYEIHAVPSLLMDQVSSFVSVHTGLPFSATWMVVAFWESVQQYGVPTVNGNTFQAIVVTDGVKSFMVSTFKNDSISWYNDFIRIGYMGDFSHFSFGPLDNSTFFELFNGGSVLYYNEVYQLSIDGAKLTHVQPVLNEVSINIKAHMTIVCLQFDLAVDAASCDTTQFLLQTLAGNVTFRPQHKAECEPLANYEYSDSSKDSVIAFFLHPSDHIRLNSMPYNEIAASDLVDVSIGSRFVRTPGHTEVTPLYFTDMLTAPVYRDTYPQITVVALYINMISAQFYLELSAPVTPSNPGSSVITLSCGEEHSQYASVEGVWSTPEPRLPNTTLLSVKMSPASFVDICSQLTCIADGYAVLQQFPTLVDVFGNSITYENNNIVTVIGPESCILGVDGDGTLRMNDTSEEMMLIGPLALYVQLSHESGDFLYPLHPNEIFLPECHGATLTVVGIVCLTFSSDSVGSPQLSVTTNDIITISLGNSTFSASATFEGQIFDGVFVCSSSEDHTVTAFTARGKTSLSTSHIPMSYSLSLGAYWHTNLTIAMCPNTNPQDIGFTNERDYPLTGLSVSNRFQEFSIHAGPLYVSDTSDVHVLAPTAESHNIYRSVFHISVEVPSVHAYTAGSSNGTTAVVETNGFVNASMTCQLENEYLAVIWFVYQGQYVLSQQVLYSGDVYSLERNGHNLQITNMALTEFLMSSFECRIGSPAATSSSIPLTNFTAVGISDPIVISTEQYQRRSGLVSGKYKNNTVFTRAALAVGVSLPCYGASGYGDLRWKSTLRHMSGLLSASSVSPHYSVQYNGSVSTLTVYSYTDSSGGESSGSLTCYSEEAGVNDAASVTVHLDDGVNRRVCLCESDGISEETPYLSLCNSTSSSPSCTCPVGYVGDGELCAVDSDHDGYTDIDMSVFNYCHSQTGNILCQQDICPNVYNHNQSPDMLQDGTVDGVAFEIGGHILPANVIVDVSHISSQLEHFRCLGSEGNVDISIQLFETVSSTTPSQYMSSEICETEAVIHLNVTSSFEAALRCHSAASGHTAWMYFTTDACMCTGTDEDTLPNFIHTCNRAGIEACDCSETECECACGYSGDGRVCIMDTDGDGYPDHEAASLCAGIESYCLKDTCPMDYDLNNDANACMEPGDTESGCESERDATWMITWTDTRSGYYNTQRCPGSVDSSASYAHRQCLSDGVWSLSIDTSCCRDTIFESVANQFDDIIEGEYTNETSSELAEALAVLVEATAPPDDRSSLYAQDLETTNEILKDTIDFLKTGVEEGSLDQLNTEIVQVVDNVLEDSNSEGWSQLSETEEEAEQLLDSVELYGSYIADAIASPNIEVDLDDGELVLNATFNNIYISASVQDPFNVDDVIFPVPKEEFSLQPVFDQSLAHIKIPASLLKKRANEANSTKVFAINMVVKNINDFLLVNGEVSNVNGTNYTTRAVTQLLVSQVVVSNTSTEKSNPLSIPVQLVFVTEQIKNLSRNPRCVYFDFNKSEWLEDGLTTDSVTKAPDGLSYHVLCSAQHFTSFAVLVDVSDVEMKISSSEAFALTLVTYIGCGISLVCLALTILFFLSYLKSLFTSVHYFVHLNLAVALFLGYAVFLLGTRYGTQSQVACSVVAGLLHYLFLSVFCWMLCEGIMLYLMLVLVFSKLSKKWWIFIMIGWGLPVIVVAVAVGLQHDKYGDPDRGFCWISVDHGLIWAFVGPMLAVIVMNIFFLCAALRSLYRVTAGKFNAGQDKVPLVRKLVMAAIILLPILGVTWAMGLLAVNRDTTVFTWLFTIFNSLQGLFFFIFHVMRSEKMRNAVTRCLPGKGKDKRGRLLSSNLTHRSSITDSTFINTLRRKLEKRENKGNELSSDAVIVLENPLATGHNPFGTKKDEDLGLTSTVLMY